MPGISKLPVVVNARRCAYGGHYGASRNAFFAADTRQGGFGRGWLHGAWTKEEVELLQEVGWWGDPERGILAGSQILALGPEAFLEVQLRVRELRARRRRSKQQRREMPPVPHCVVQDGTLVHGNALPCLRLRRLSRRYDEKLM